MSLSFCWRNLSRRPLTPAENARCFRNRRRFFLGKVNNFVLDRFMFVLSTAKTARYCFGVLLRWAEAHFHVVSASTSLLWYGNKVQYGSVGVNLANEPHKKRDYLFPPDRYVPSPCQNTKFVARGYNEYYHDMRNIMETIFARDVMIHSHGTRSCVCAG
jgi:hypothetical protein